MSGGFLTNLAMLWYLIQVVSKNILPSIQTRKRPIDKVYLAQLEIVYFGLMFQELKKGLSSAN